MSQREPAVAGQFYPNNPAELQKIVENYINTSEEHAINSKPKALIVPHAGYAYSGQLAAQAFSCLKDYADEIKQVILLGPSHRIALEGCALPEDDYFSTPLGLIEVDKKACKSLLDLGLLSENKQAHQMEHSLEVQLPFLQNCLNNFKLVPIVIGHSSTTQVEKILDALANIDELKQSLIVISTDLSHYHCEPDAAQIDHRTIEHILALDEHITMSQACGCFALNGGLSYFKHQGWKIKLLKKLNSSAINGSKERVVGYASFVLSEEMQDSEHLVADTDNLANKTSIISETHSKNNAVLNSSLSTELSDKDKSTLKEMIKRVIMHGCTTKDLRLPEAPSSLKLLQPAACFITLYENIQLRGCIGTCNANKPLWQNACEFGFASAFQDSRFPALQENELDQLRIQISILSQPIALDNKGEQALRDELVKGVDGLIMQQNEHKAIFLPIVWEKIHSTDKFIKELKKKGGWQEDYWSEDIELFRFTTQVY